jgi:ABC-type lipoprotein release transport system permease subunit
MLYGLSAHDGGIFALSAVVLVAVALLATLLPARRALDVEPMAALRYE